MNNNINLLDYRTKINIQSYDTKHRSLRIVATGLLFIVSGLSIVFFLLIALSPLPDLIKQQEKVSSNLELEKNNIAKLALVKDRVENIKTIIDKRTYLDKELESIQTKIPSGIKIDNLNLSKGKVSLTLKTQSLALFKDFLDEITRDKETGGEFSEVKLVELTADPLQNTYLLTIQAETI